MDVCKYLSKYYCHFIFKTDCNEFYLHSNLRGFILNFNSFTKSSTATSCHQRRRIMRCYFCIDFDLYVFRYLTTHRPPKRAHYRVGMSWSELAVSRWKGRPSLKWLKWSSLLRSVYNKIKLPSGSLWTSWKWGEIEESKNKTLSLILWQLVRFFEQLLFILYFLSLAPISS